MYKSGISFKILAQDVIFYSDELGHGTNTVAEIDEKYHYLGDKLPNIATAIALWEKLNNKILNREQVIKILQDNNLTSA